MVQKWLNLDFPKYLDEKLTGFSTYPVHMLNH